MHRLIRSAALNQYVETARFSGARAVSDAVCGFPAACLNDPKIGTVTEFQ
jgi:hypothetical protein